MIYRISHKTAFSYSSEVSDTVFELRMGPVSGPDQTVLSYELRVDPVAPVLAYRDGFGNRVDLFSLSRPFLKLSLEATSFVRTHRIPAHQRLNGSIWKLPEVYPIDALEFLGPSPLVDRSPDLDNLVRQCGALQGPFLEQVQTLMQTVIGKMAYEKRVTTAQTRLSEALAIGRGVCQDFAHLFLGLCRALGLPARYVSGYVSQPGEIETHAWCQVWSGPETGWIDVDPTSAKFPADEYVSIAVGRDYSDVPPNRGLWKGEGEESMDVGVTVEPVEQAALNWDEWSSSVHRQRILNARADDRPRLRGGPVDTPSSAFPDQPAPKAGLYRQQGQQQQQGG